MVIFLSEIRLPVSGLPYVPLNPNKHERPNFIGSPAKFRFLLFQ